MTAWQALGALYLATGAVLTSFVQVEVEKAEDPNDPIAPRWSATWWAGTLIAGLIVAMIAPIVVVYALWQRPR